MKIIIFLRFYLHNRFTSICRAMHSARTNLNHDSRYSPIGLVVPVSTQKNK